MATSGAVEEAIAADLADGGRLEGPWTADLWSGPVRIGLETRFAYEPVLHQDSPMREQGRKEQGAAGDVLSRGTLPEDPGRALTGVNPPSLEELLGLFERFVRNNPERAGEAVKRFQQVADAHRPPDTQRNLGIKDAVRITGLSVPRIYQLAEEGRLGKQEQGKRWRFSEAELWKYRDEPRKPGPQPR